MVAYTYSHFSVDFTCFYILFNGFKNNADSLEIVTLGFLLYNVIAFGLQPIIGYYCDYKPNIPVGLIGSVTVLAALFLLSFSWIALVLCAVGNAFFHIGGGIDSLMFANGKMARSGIFVSTGALGVALGSMVGQSESDVHYIPFSIMMLSVFMLIMYVKRAKPSESCEFKVASELPYEALLILALTAVFIRAFVGGIIPIEWKTGTYLLLLPSMAAFLGKASGGILGDRFGARRVGVFALILSIPFLLFGVNIILVSLIGIILFNITMPISLCIIASKFPKNPGLAFGLTTLALLCGSIPGYFFLVSQDWVQPVLIALTVISSVCILIASKNGKGVTVNEQTIQQIEQQIV